MLQRECGLFFPLFLFLVRSLTHSLSLQLDDSSESSVVSEMYTRNLLHSLGSHSSSFVDLHAVMLRFFPSLPCVVAPSVSFVVVVAFSARRMCVCALFLCFCVVNRSEHIRRRHPQLQKLAPRPPPLQDDSLQQTELRRRSSRTVGGFCCSSFFFFASFSSLFGWSTPRRSFFPARTSFPW